MIGPPMHARKGWPTRIPTHLVCALFSPLHATQVLQTFNVPYIDAKRKITGFVLPFDTRYSLKHFSNIIFGSGRCGPRHSPLLNR